MRRSTGLLIGGVAALALLAGACTGETEVTVEQPRETGISVTGTGSVTVVPDIGVISIGVEATGPTVGEARTAAADAMTAITQSAIGNGVEERDIRTEYFNIWPQYSYPEGGAPQVTGYTVNTSAAIKVRNVDSLSQVLDGAIAAGGDLVRVNNFSFSVDEPEQYLAEAREEAMADAKARAEQLAQLSGASLGAVRAVNEYTGGGVPMPYEAAAGQGGGGVTPTSPGEQQVTLNVTVTYDIN